MSRGQDNSISTIKARLKTLSDPIKAKELKRFFKTGPGEYGEGDAFLGIRVPVLRKLAKTWSPLSLKQVKALLKSRMHEERMTALLILMDMFKKGDGLVQEKIYRLYMTHTQYVNNWDLVDVSAEHVVGAYLWDKDKTPLHHLARSDLVWDRRIAVLATFHFIKRGRFDHTLHVAQRLLTDKHDLIHKAVGWMLREIGKRDMGIEEGFLKKHYAQMPRTMLRYAIEKFPEIKRQKYLKGEI